VGVSTATSAGILQEMSKGRYGEFHEARVVNTLSRELGQINRGRGRRPRPLSNFQATNTKCARYFTSSFTGRTSHINI
jgi:hypothetical protein